MKTLVLYGTKHGCAEECAKTLSDKLSGEIDLYNIKHQKDIDLSQYNKVIIGGSIYMGKIQKEVSSFCSNRFMELKDKKVGLFICCMRIGEVAETELNDVFPKELVETAIFKKPFGGAFTFQKMNLLERFIVKKVANVEEDTSMIQYQHIDQSAQMMNES